MRAALRLMGLVLGLFAALIAATWIIVFATPAGRGLLGRVVEAQLARVTGGTARIGAIDGASPARLVFRDVVLSDRRGAYLEARRVEIVWRPMEAVGGRILVDHAALEGVEALRRPETPSRKHRGVKLPDRLPRVTIKSLMISDFGVRAGDRKIRLDGAGRLAIGGRLVDIRFDARSDVGDRALIDVFIDAKAESVAISADVTAPAGGAVAALLGVRGAIDVRARGEGPPDRFRTSIAAEIAGVGRADARLRGDVSNRIVLAVEGAVAPERRAVVDAWGPRIAFDLELSASETGWRAAVRRLASDAGSADGAVEVAAASDGTINAALARLQVRPAAKVLRRAPPPFGEIVGDAIRIDAAARRRGAFYAINATLAGKRATLRLQDVAARDGAVGGVGELSVLPSDAGPSYLRRGGDARSAFRRDVQGTWRFGGLRVSSPEAGAISGEGLFNASSRRIEVNGLAALKPSFFQTRGLSPTKDTPVKINVSGTLDALDIALDAAIPSSQQITASRFTARLQGSPGNLIGRIAWTSGAAAASASVARSARELRLDQLRIAAPQISADGWVAWSPARGRIETDLRYTAQGDARIWPGVAVGGTGAVKGAVALSGNESARLDARFDRLLFRTQRLDAAIASVVGPRDALAVTLGARRWNFGPGAVSALIARAEIDLAAGRGVLHSMTAKSADARLGLVRPASLRFKDEYAVDGLSVAYGRASINADAALSPRRWRATIDVRDAPLAAAAGDLDVSVDLDTDRAEPAHGVFRASADAGDGPPILLAGAFSWDGARLRLRDGGSDASVDFDVAAPLLLRRGPLRVASEGALSGSARFAGRVGALADFLPPALQTIEGDLEASARFAGTVARPAIIGRLALRNATYTELATGLVLVGVALDAEAEPAYFGTRIRLAAQGRGPAQTGSTINFSGEARLGEAAAFDGALSFKNAALSTDFIESAVVNGNARLSGPLSRLILSGSLDVAPLKAELRTPRQTGLVPIEVRARGVDAPAVQPAPRPFVSFDLALNSASGVSLYGRGLDSVWTATLGLAGDSASPIVAGRLDLRRGTFDFSNKRFQLTQGSVVFDRLDRNNPALNLRAEYTTRDGVLAVITVKGRAAQPEVSLTSNPAAPPEDVAALVLFDKRAVELSAVESLKAAQALAQLSGVGGGATRALGLDMLNVDFDSETGVGAVSVGKTIADGFFVSAKQDVRGENGSVRLQYGLSDRFSVETELKQNGDQTVSANWKRDF